MFLRASNSVSKEFYDLIKCIGESRSKQEEDRILEAELRRLQVHFRESGSVHPQRMKELVIRALYCHMLGHDISFSYIQGLSLSSSKELWCKRTGYLIAGQVLGENSELLLLTVNTIQKDLRSSNYLETCSALNVIANRIHLEAIPIILPTVVGLLDHPRACIKKKALGALMYIYHRSSDVAVLPTEKLRDMIHSTDANVLLALMNLYELMYERQQGLSNKFFSSDYIPLIVPQLVSVLKSVVFARLPDHQEYHRVSSPWLQMKIMRLIGLLVKKNLQLSQECYEVLRHVLATAAEHINNISFAVQYECILTIASIYPHLSLCRKAAHAIGQFVESPNRNLRLAGLNGLIKLVDIDPTFIQGHQITIIDSLEDSDETIRTKALELLAQTTTSTNVLAVVDKLLASADMYWQSSLRREMVLKSYELIDRFAPCPQDYINTMCRLMTYHPQYFEDRCVTQFMAVVAEGPGGADEKEVDDQFRKLCVDALAKVLTNAEGNVLVVCVWGLSCCAYTAAGLKQDLFTKIVARVRESDTASLSYGQRSSIVSSLLHIVDLIGAETNRAVAERLMNEHLQPLVDEMQSEHWVAAITEQMEEYRATAHADCSLYPVLGYTEDVSRFITLENIEACLEVLNVTETAVMRDIVERDEPEEVKSVLMHTTLMFRPYEDQAAPKVARPPPMAARSAAVDFAVRASGSRWTIEGLSSRERKLTSAPRKGESPTHTASEFVFTSGRKPPARSQEPPPPAQPSQAEAIKMKEAGKLFAGVV